MNTKKKVFISWSKKYSGEIAKIIKTYLEDIFGNKVDFFISKEIDTGQIWHEEISKALQEADMGIFILTSENINAPWILFEAGGIFNIKKPLCMLLFGRDKQSKFDQIESPFKHIMHSSFYDKNGKKFFCDLLKNVNKYCDIGFNANVLGILTHSKADSFMTEIEPLVEEMNKTVPSDNNKMMVEQQSGIDLSVSNVFPNYRGKKIQDIPDFFHEATNKFPIKYCKENGSSNPATVFLINNTRISTFIAITDGERIVLFDRNKGKNLTSVENDRFDVFGSVPFENRTLLTKLKNSPLLEFEIEEIQAIHGFAFEDNMNKDLFRETVIMFGYAIYVSKEDLNKIPSEGSNVLVRSINEVPRNLTAKADLACQFLSKKDKKV
jgi:hypothetical protein